MKDNGGFALLLMTSLLPLLLAGFLLVFALLGLIQVDLSMKYICRTEGLRGQNKVGPLLTSLLALNPKAQVLKKQYLEAQVSLAAAELTGNPALIAKAAYRLSVIQSRRLSLDILQKQYITQSNILLHRSHFTITGLLRNKIRELDKRLIFFDLNLNLLSEKPPRLAVRPDSMDRAPTYSLELRFDELQSLAQTWQYSVSPGAPMNTFFQFKHRFTKSCSVGLRKDHHQWIAVINKGKFSSKQLW